MVKAGVNVYSVYTHWLEGKARGRVLEHPPALNHYTVRRLTVKSKNDAMAFKLKEMKRARRALLFELMLLNMEIS